MLDIQVPLLHIRPSGFARNRGNRQRRRASAKQAGIEVVIAGDVHHARGLGLDVIRLEQVGIRFIAVGVLEENAVTTPDGPFPVALRIEGKPNARRGVEPVVCHAARGNARRHSTVDPPVVRIAGDESCRGIHAAGSWHVKPRIEIVGQVIQLPISSKETDPQSQVEGQAPADMPVILNIGFVNVIEVVQFELGLLLSEAADITEQKIGVSIARSERRVRAIRGISETQQAVRRVRRLRNLVLVRVHEIHAELQVVRPDDLGQVVAEGERRVRI